VRIIFIAFITLACLSQCAHPAGVVEPSGAGMIFVVSVLLFISGLCLAPSYYLLVNLYSIEAGKDDCATLVGIFELVAFGSKGLADPWLLGMADNSSWKETIATLSLLALVSSVLLTIFYYRCEAIRVCGLLADNADTGVLKQSDAPVSDMEATVEAGKELEDGFVKEYAAMRRKPVNGMSE